MLKPCRNKIVFTGIPSKLAIEMCNESLQEYIYKHFEEFREKEQYTLCIDNFNIVRSETTFHQNDDNIRGELYKILFPVLAQKYENVLFIGGECYLFGALVNAKNIYTYSDSESIISDCNRNPNIYGGNIHTKLVNYSSIEIENIEYDLCILNVSKKGLGKHLSNLIASLKIPTFYISCNKKSFLKDNLISTKEWIFDNGHYQVTLYKIF